MKTVKSLLVMLLALMMVFALCACGGEETPTTSSSSIINSNPDDDSQGPNDNPPVEPEYVYTITVKDTNGNPIPDLNVQICAGDTCVPQKTDENGIAGYDKAVEGAGELTAKLVNPPENYVGVTEISMEGETDVVFILTDVSSYVYTVSVVDTEGNAISEVNVQICAGDSCVPKKTDVNGIAGYTSAVEGNGERSAKLIRVPDGYSAVEGIMEIVMGEETDVVFVLEKLN